MRSSLRRDVAGIKPLTALVIAGLLVLVGGVVYQNTIGKPPASPPPPSPIERGDRVTVDYIGYFADGSGTFDTSILSDAQDNATWPKAITFTWKTVWSPLGPIIAGNRSVIPGFDEGLLGMVQGETKTIMVPPNEGYGVANPALFYTRPLLQNVPVREQMNQSIFKSRYLVAPVDGSFVTDPFWNWPVLIRIVGSVVTVTNSPTLGQMVRPYGAWDARVQAIDDTANNGVGIIRVQNMLTPVDVARVLVRDGSRAFAVSEVDLAAGEYVADYNFRAQGSGFIWIGKVMVFQVTVVTVVTP